MAANLSALLYIVSGVLFIMALRGLSHPTTSRQGNRYGMIGMAIAIVTTVVFFPPSGFSGWLLVIIGIAIGGGIGAVMAKRVQMTQMPPPMPMPAATSSQPEKPDGGKNTTVVTMAIAMPIMP